MVHRLQSRGAGYNESSSSILAKNQTILNATEGATALNIETAVEQNKDENQGGIKIDSEEEMVHEPLLENISMENAEYLQNSENASTSSNFEINNDISKFDENQLKVDIPTFEVDSIELATPELFSNDGNEDNSFNQDINSNEKEPEMFAEDHKEEDFEIPAFLRKQKN